jgi:hypothetical protein
VKTYGLDGSVVATLDGFDLDTVEQILGAWSADGSKVVIAGEFKVEGQTTGAVILADGNLGNASVVYTEQYLNPLNVQFLPDGRILITRFAGITVLDAAGSFVASTDWPGERETKCGPFYNTRLFCPRPDAAGTGLYVLFHDSNGQHLHHMSLDLATDEVLTEGMVLVQKEDLHFNPGRTAVFIGDAHKDHGHRVMDLPGGATHTGFLDAELGRKVIGFQ